MAPAGILGGSIKAILMLLVLTSPLHANDRLTEHPELETIFDRHGVTGTFVLLDVVNDHIHVFDADRAAHPRVPASTFKIANSLIALETGAVQNESEVIPVAHETPATIKRKRSMSMREAIKVSNVPVYQTLARRIGSDAYNDWLERLDYGNRQTGGDVETFWLKGPLKISPRQQVYFLADLARGELNVTEKTQNIVRDILLHEQSGGARVYAKTGWSIVSKVHNGWWVGWVERGEDVYTFALNIDISSPRDADQRIPLGKALLSAMDVY